MAMHRERIPVLLAALVLSTACTPGGGASPFLREAPPPATVTAEAPAPAPPDRFESLAEPASTVSAPPPAAELELGSGQFVGQGRGPFSRPMTGNGQDVTLNFQGVGVQEVVKAVLGDLLQRNYVIDPDVAGPVTIQTARPLARTDLLPVLESILAMHGAVLQERGGTLHVLARERALGGAPARLTSPAAGLGVRIVPLQHIAAEEMQKILQPLLPDRSLVHVDRKRNLLLLSGTAEELHQLLDTVQIFDVDWMRGMSVGLFPLKHVDPATLLGELEAALDGSDGELLSGIVRTIPIDRMNAVLAVSSRPNALHHLQAWIDRLDRISDRGGRRLYVYRLQNAKAVDVARILSKVYGADTTAAPMRDRPRITSAAQPVLMEAPRETLPPGEAAGILATSIPAGIAGQPFPGDAGVIRIIADESRNALVIHANAQEYEMIEDAVRKLDTEPMQVLIEASIVEVSLTDALEYGLEWFFKNNFGSKQGRGLLDLGGGLNPLIPGFSYALVDNANQVRLILNALAEESRINVLSSPSLMVLDNQTATINVGDEIPIPTRQAVSVIDPDAPTVNEIQYRNTGVILEVTPRVNAGGLVTMDIRQEVSDAVQTQSSTLNAPTIQQREIRSSVAVHSGETIALGGLIRDSRTLSETGIPVLHRIPVLGKLFGQTTDTGRRTELLVLITPRAVSSRNEARGVTEEFRRKLSIFQPEFEVTDD